LLDGLIRKTLFVSTLGAIRMNSKKQRVPKGHLASRLTSSGNRRGLVNAGTGVVIDDRL
jgi:hypothetical protein